MSLKIIGISVKTTNQNGQAVMDIGQLWGKLYTENIIDKIPNKKGSDVYSIYTDYETDYTGNYTTIIGMEVSSLDVIPEGLIGREFQPQKFIQFTAKGEFPQAIAETWKEIWGKDAELNRSYTYDYEIYSAKSTNGENSEVDIFIAVEK